MEKDRGLFAVITGKVSAFESNSSANPEVFLHRVEAFIATVGRAFTYIGGLLREQDPLDMPLDEEPTRTQDPVDPFQQ